MRFITSALVLLITACTQTGPVRLVPESECYYVFGGAGNQFLGCRSDPYVNQTG